MSHIPNNAMPKAGDIQDEQNTAAGGTGGSATGRAFSQLAGKAREYPKTSIAAGAAVAAGVVAAAAMTVRNRRSDQD
jgi:hypothetical protein